jgi:uncharacterized RDD family membrane protein YckC
VSFDRDLRTNPYSPPGSDFNAGVVASSQTVELAERGTRLWAVSIDGMLICIPLLPLMAIAVYFAVVAEAAAARATTEAEAMPAVFGLGPEGMLAVLGVATLVCMLGALGIAIYQWVLISRTGQSLGKKWTGIRIELLDSRPVTFGTGVFLRNWVPKLIGAVPYLGALFQLVDCLYIFRGDRRCIHDHIAGTRVVRLQR